MLWSLNINSENFSTKSDFILPNSSAVPSNSSFKLSILKLRLLELRAAPYNLDLRSEFSSVNDFISFSKFKVSFKFWISWSLHNFIDAYVP